ncbi:cyclin-L1 isoform 4-T4 [Podargus strigoides]
MVLLSAPRWLRSRLTDRFWRVQEVLKYARHFRGRKNRCYKLAVRSVRRAFVKSTKARREKKRFLRALWITRIEAASLEHGLKYPAFISNLFKVAMATGQVLFQRFFYTKSFVKHSMEHVSMACVHLASKIEEAPRRIRDVINVFHRLRQLREKKKPVPLILDQEYVNLKNQIIKAERRVLKELGFCVHVKHPHKIIVMYLQVLECERNQHLVQTSWNYMNDSLRTDVFVRFQPESIACACIYLAARTLEIPLPNRPHWFLLFGTTEEEIQEICLKILQLYTRKKVDLSDLESKIEKKKLAIEEAKAQAKGLVPEGAPSLDNTSGFSPVPKNESPKEVKGNKPSPLPVQAMKNAKRKIEGAKRTSSNSPVNGVQKGRESRSRSGSRDQSYSRSPSRSASPKHRKSESYSTSSGSKSHSRSRSRSDSPPRQFNHTSTYKSSKNCSS